MIFLIVISSFSYIVISPETFPKSNSSIAIFVVLFPSMIFPVVEIFNFAPATISFIITSPSAVIFITSTVPLIFEIVTTPLEEIFKSPPAKVRLEAVKFEVVILISLSLPLTVKTKLFTAVIKFKSLALVSVKVSAVINLSILKFVAFKTTSPVVLIVPLITISFPTKLISLEPLIS